MLENAIIKLSDKFNYTYSKAEDGKFVLNISEIVINITKINNEVYLDSPIVLCPNEKKESLFTYLMKANLLGQGTGNSAIGLDNNEKFLTLTNIIDYEEIDKSFEERVEDFVNYLLFWQKEINKIKLQETIF